MLAHLNRVDMLERAADSLVRQVLLHRALQVIHVLLVQNLAQSALLIPFVHCFSVERPLSSMSI